MAETMTILDFLLSLIRDEDAREEFNENPEKALDDAGLGNLTADDVHDALLLMRDDSQSASFDRNYDTGDNEINIAAPHPVNHDGDDADSVVEYISHYITNNYVDDRDTIVDNSTNQQIDTGGGDFSQDIDIDSTVASGDGSVAAGDDIEDSTIVSGDGNVVGDGNVSGDGNITGDDNQAVIGDGNTTSFGDGDATSVDVDGDLSADDGGAISIGGDASVDNTDNSITDSFNKETDIEDSFNNETDYEDNSDNSVDNSYEDNSRNDDHSDRDLHIQA